MNNESITPGGQVPDVDLPGMWEPADLSGGWADTENESREARKARAFPHGPNEPCTCDGCHDGKYGCTGHVVGCTCDIEWDWDC